MPEIIEERNDVVFDEKSAHKNHECKRNKDMKKRRASIPHVIMVEIDYDDKFRVFLTRVQLK